MWHAGISTFRTPMPKKIVLSGPSGFLGQRVLHCILEIHKMRIDMGLDPGELVLLSSSPGRLMERISKVYDASTMANVRASRVDYYTQHDHHEWKNQMGALGLGGESSVFVNLAAVAGPVEGKPNAMQEVNYYAPLAAARASQHLKFGHFIQSSSMATRTERAGQVPYSKHKSMGDYALSTAMGELNISIATLGLLYCKEGGSIGQSRGEGSGGLSATDATRKKGAGLSEKDGEQIASGLSRDSSINLTDLSLLPLTPIMGNGKAPVQPQEVQDAARRLCLLAYCCPASRPDPLHSFSAEKLEKAKEKSVTIRSAISNQNLRIYDAVGPEEITMADMLEKFAVFQLRPKGAFKKVCLDGYISVLLLSCSITTGALESLVFSHLYTYTL